MGDQKEGEGEGDGEEGGAKTENQKKVKSGMREEQKEWVMRSKEKAEEDQQRQMEEKIRRS